MHRDLTAAHRAIEGIMQAVNNGCVADYGSFIVVMKSAVVVLSDCNVAAAAIRDEFKAAYLALYIMRQGCAVWFCIESFFQLFARKKLLANEISVTFKASKTKKDSNDDQSSNRNR